MSDHPDHLAVCAACPMDEITQAEKDQISESSKNFHQQAKQHT